MNVSTDTDIISEILDGEHDNLLKSIGDSISARYAYLNRQRGAKNMNEVKKGDLVRITNISPKYLSGLKGVVIGFDLKRNLVEINLTEHSRIFARKYRNVKVLRILPSCIEIIEQGK